MISAITNVFCTILTILTLSCLLTSSVELFAQYEADSSMFPSQHDKKPPIDFIPKAEDSIMHPGTYAHVPSATQVTSSTPPADLSSEQSRIPEISGLIFVISLMLLFIGLAHINSDKYRLAVTERFRHIDLIVDASYDVMAVMNVSTCQMDISDHKFVPRSVYGKQLSVVRENSQELENFWL